MHYFSSITLPELAPILAIMAGMLIGFYKILEYILNSSKLGTDADRTERQDLAQAIKLMADSNLEIAKETKQGNKEAKQRNGHLGEQNIEIAKLVSAQSNDITGIRNSNELIARTLSKSAVIAAEDRDVLINPVQHIDVQQVDKQIIKGNV